jgi:hypothetical protein
VTLIALNDVRMRHVDYLMYYVIPKIGLSCTDFYVSAGMA